MLWMLASLPTLHLSAETTDSLHKDKLWIESNIGFARFSDVTISGGYDGWFGGYIAPYHHTSIYTAIDGGIALHYNTGVGSFTGRFGAIDNSTDTTLAHTNGDNSYSSTYAGGSIGLNFPYVGIDLGLLYFNKLHSFYFPLNDSHIQPTGKLRIGFEDSWYFSMSFLTNNTLISEGGIFNMGCGFRFSNTQSSMWIGFGAYPQNTEFIVHAVIAPKEWKPAFLVTAHIGPHESDPVDFGLSVGLKWNIL